MSFQHFRLGELSLHQPLPPHLAVLPGAPASSTSTFSAALNTTNSPFPTSSTKSSSKAPYGSGDTDDGYTLVFPNLEAFHEWRAQEEERQTVEFGDTHGSKAVPPRFKDHTKLVCARHSRSGRKKYVKKHPERVRKVPSRKLEGQGCPASISYKTYFDTDEVRACYISQHSHEVGLANLPFTRRGRKAAQREKERTTTNASTADVSTPAPTVNNVNNAIAGPSLPPQQPPNMFASTVSMLAPLPGQSPYQHPPPQPFTFAPLPHQFQPPPAIHPAMSHERWENMATLFNSVREHARGFEYPGVSVAALETILIRLYLESPVGLSTQPSMAAIMQNHIPPPRTQASQVQVAPNPPHINGNASDGTGEDSS
ncbi:hypothetical protein D9615_001334 [Tricholomella constricta]|uniref:Uncharacterized protein n=1 Tax=Tricholomella constricta TaxID=117010 RepID=A0A8H5M886_9AGAR|nr:hypothetical protein D9615_001334 [Tricholomella constricta]